MKVLSLVFIIFVSFVGSHQIELLDEEHEITEQGRKSGRAVVDMKDACRLVTVPAKVFCSDSNPCLTDKNRASRLTCTIAATGVSALCPAATPYCYEPNPGTPGSALCTATRNLGCDAIDARECSASPGKKFCLNNSPCITTNSIRQCDADSNVKKSNLLIDCTGTGYIGCFDATGGDPKCIKQVPWYCPNAVPYTCTGEGFYPNAFNCRQYFQCINSGGIVPAKDCPIGQVFDPMANKNGNPCKVNSGKNCVESMCGAGVGGGNILLEYPGYSKSYGSYAVACGGQQPKVYRCEDGFEPNLQVNPITCTGKCPGNNKRAVDPSNLYGFYTCSYNGASYIGSQSVCPINASSSGIFSKTRKVCQ